MWNFAIIICSYPGWQQVAAATWPCTASFQNRASLVQTASASLHLRNAVVQTVQYLTNTGLLVCNFGPELAVH